MEILKYFKRPTEIRKLLRYFLFFWVLSVVLGFGIMFLKLNEMRHWPSTQAAFEFLGESEEIEKKVGNVKRFGFFISGNRTVRNDHSGKANLTIKIIGELSTVSATVYLDCDQQNGWVVRKVHYN